MYALVALGAVILVVVERCFPARVLPSVPGWTLRALVVNALELAVVVLVGAWWKTHFSGLSLFDLADWPPLAGGVVAYLVATFVFYWWHRARHASDLLWRALHQVHHSATRIELATTFYKHPLEMLINATLGALIAYPLLGLDRPGRSS